MTPEPIDIARGNRRYQDQMAAALVAGFGCDGAFSFCRSNGWDGVLDALVDRVCRPRRRGGLRWPATAGRAAERSF